MPNPSPDTRQRLSAATRFFARVVSADLECPHCGTVYSIRHGWSQKTHRPQPYWNRYTARFKCTAPDCGRVYVLGILAWPIKPTPGVASQTPADQIPHPRQLAALRKEAEGWWMADRDAQKHRRPLETNLTLEHERPEEE